MLLFWFGNDVLEGLLELEQSRHANGESVASGTVHSHGRWQVDLAMGSTLLDIVCFEISHFKLSVDSLGDLYAGSRHRAVTAAHGFIT